jgi:hypothetical protein
MEGEKEDPLVLNVDKNNARAAAVARQAGIGKKRKKGREKFAMAGTMAGSLRTDDGRKAAGAEILVKTGEERKKEKKKRKRVLFSKPEWFSR